jgi:hypothetical protein
VNDVFIDLFDPENPPALGPGPRSGRLSVAAIDAALASVPSTDAGSQALIRAVALLWHDHHDAAHALVQDATGGVGAYIHGMLHRREPDFWNAKYWFRRVGALPFLKPLGQRVENLPGAGTLVAAGKFDPSRFVDAVEAIAPDAEMLLRVQEAEFMAVLDHLAE